MLVAAGFGAPAAAADPAGQITEFSSGLTTENPFPEETAPGPDGNVWFTDHGTTNAIGRITPSGQITEFQGSLTASSEPGSLTVGPDGNLWFTDGLPAAIGRITPTGQMTEFPISGFPADIAAGPDGNLWFTDQTTPAIGRITPSGGVTLFTAGLNMGSAPNQIAQGPDGNLWFTDLGTTRAVGRITQSGAITEYDGANGLLTGSVPEYIAPGSDGSLWFTDFACHFSASGKCAIGKVAPNGSITEYTVSSAHLPAGIAPGADGNMWFTDRGGSAGTLIGRITPSGTISESSIGLNPGSFPDGITPGSDGNLWFGDRGSPAAIGKVGTGAPSAVQAPPTLAGAARPGSAEICQPGQWATWAGAAPSQSLYGFDGVKWLRDGTPIAGQTTQSYTPSSTDVGHQLTCSVTVTYPLPFLVTTTASSPAVTVQPLVSTPPPPLPLPPPPAPVGALSGLKLSPRSFSLAGRKVGGRCVKPTATNKRRAPCTRRVTLTVRYTLTTATNVTFRINGSVPGRRAAGRCVTQTSKNRNSKKCTRRVTLLGADSRAGKAGTNTLVFVRKLAPGSYTLTATPTGDSPQQVTFKILA